MAEEIEMKIKQLSDVKALILTSIVTALAFVVGLFWNDAIRSTIEQIVPKGESLFYKYLAAIIVSIIVAIFVYILIHSQRLAEQRLKKIVRKEAKG